MRRILTALAALSFFAVALPAAAQSLPSKKEAAVLLGKAADSANLWAADTPPHHLATRVHLQLGDKAYEGTYDLWWAAPDKYREVFQMQVGARTMTETDWALEDKFYVLRNAPTLSFPLWETRVALNSTYRSFYWGDSPKASRVFSAKAGSERHTCVDSDSETMRTETCFDPGTLDVFSSSASPFTEDSHSPPEFADIAKSERLELAEFTNFSHKRYPRRITRHLLDLVLQIDVATLEEVPRFADDTFVPSPQATEFGWCPEPTIGKSFVDWRSAPTLKMHRGGGYTAYYILTGLDGQVQKTATLRSGGTQFDAQMEDWLHGTRQPIHTCGGKPIEWEAVIWGPESIMFF